MSLCQRNVVWTGGGCPAKPKTFPTLHMKEIIVFSVGEMEIVLNSLLVNAC